jgi:ATP-dependent Clp protease, protease subunit
MNIINISGEIGWDVMPDDIKKQLAEAKGKDIEVHVASPGGFVFDGIEIFNAFRDYKKQYPKAQMMLTIKGLAASMASYLAVNPAFDYVLAEDNAVFMIHNAWGGAVGDYREMKKTAEVLEGISDLLGQAYAKKTGKKKEEIKKSMDEESWYFGSEILEHGFVDDIIKAPEKIEKEKAVIDASIKFQAVSEKLVKNKLDVMKLAAVLKPDTEIPDNISVTPAANSAGENNNITGGVVMTLDELKSQHPALYAEIFKAGYDSGKAEAMAVASKAATFAANKEYPEQIHAVALDVMQGKKSVETLETLVANADMIKEMLKSKSAQEEQPEGGNGQQEIPLSTDGTISSFADLKAEAARLKGVN